ncbi:probable plastid-lipid-associated protein 10, chloroplastic [Impatiens glandulifera]|uniref:probable plastid-lipid-associated protein 10, chloroplastic n=1 Tax=Impatiens glandulifera TaxID=253017 RepID=UPI001FB161C8|nr:probable plastid-lipid-associated protein 10, chloroplastic [Impatiens glandulifera]
MNLAFAFSVPTPVVQRNFWNKMFLSDPMLKRNCFTKKIFQISATVSANPSQDAVLNLENVKHRVLNTIQDTKRGLATSSQQRSDIEEVLVELEKYGAGTSIDMQKLDGTWRLQYTSASDVLILFESAERLPFLQVGQVYQKFECQDQTDRGVVRNIVKWSVSNLLEDQEGCTLCVTAKFSIVSPRNIYLQFEEAAIQDINISPELQALLAPAILPRSFLNLQILQFIRTFKAQFPLTSQTNRQTVGGLYYLSYLDGNMLLGRAATGGVFVFTRSQPIF